MFVNNEDIKTTRMEGGIVRRLLGYSGKIMACEMIFPKGAHVEPHCHTAQAGCH